MKQQDDEPFFNRDAMGKKTAIGVSKLSRLVAGNHGRHDDITRILGVSRLLVSNERETECNTRDTSVRNARFLKTTPWRVNMIYEPLVSEYLETELTAEVAEPIARLACRSFPSSTTVAGRIQRMLSAAGSRDPEKTSGRRFVIWQRNQAIAHARVFIRQVKIESQTIPVLALATVCSDPDRRGSGLGRQVTRRAFQLVSGENWPAVSLFQTPVPEFYQKLNSRIVTNRFVNRLNRQDPEANPWRDECVMIYPAEYPWPSGVVDLNGPDY